MADTKISDVIVPEVFNPYVWNLTRELTLLRMGGIVSNDAELDRLASTGGNTLNMPFWNDLTGADEVLDDSAPLTPEAITAGQDVAVLHLRGKAWAVNDLAAALAGDDPMRGVADLVAGYWARQQQKTLISSLRGVFADNVANDASDMVHDVSAVVGDGAKFSAEAYLDAEATFGDAIGRVAGVAVHSVIYNAMRKQNLIDFLPDSEGKPTIAVYMGKRVLVDDGMPVSGSGADRVFTSYLFGDGAIGYGEGAPKVPTETDRDSLAGIEYLITRRHFLMHPRGIRWLGASVAGAAPSNTELAAAANWNRVYDRKQIRIASLVSKA
ncbi:major capsid protein [Stutzerimonas kunmingensis]|uniref:major capsid protein n=1 Tax=Stutzerimonas kunmingensis TaxID=1211807 RepID=UPI0028AE3612|nr:major capsid protein [Stutzerimonas kunmingensis]